jgi:hypothetical protein
MLSPGEYASTNIHAHNNTYFTSIEIVHVAQASDQLSMMPVSSNFTHALDAWLFEIEGP